MKKQIIVYGTIAIACILMVFVLIFLNSKKTVSSIKDANDMKNMLKTIYKDVDLPSLESRSIDVKNTNEVMNYTGLSNTDDIEVLVASEPLMNAQAYLALVIKVKDNADIEKIKEEMYENANMNRWICVSAEKLYITNNGNIIFFVMASEDRAKPVYEGFKKYVNNAIGKELEKNNSQGGTELPPIGPVA